MTIIKIDNQEYELDQLSAEAKAQLGAIQFCDQELARMQTHAAALQTAKNAYLQSLKSSLPNLGDAIKFT